MYFCNEPFLIEIILIFHSADNSIPVLLWFSDFHDTALLDLLPILDA